MHENLGIALGAEHVAPDLQLVSQLGMVEHLARRCHHDLAVLIGKRLARTRVGRTESHVSEADPSPDIEPVSVGASMAYRGGHEPQRPGANSRWSLSRNSGYAAHWTFTFRRVAGGRSFPIDKGAGNTARPGRRTRTVAATSASLAPANFSHSPVPFVTAKCLARHALSCGRWG